MIKNAQLLTLALCFCYSLQCSDERTRLLDGGADAALGNDSGIRRLESLPLSPSGSATSATAAAASSSTAATSEKATGRNQVPFERSM